MSTPPSDLLRDELLQRGREMRLAETATQRAKEEAEAQAAAQAEADCKVKLLDHLAKSSLGLEMIDHGYDPRHLGWEWTEIVPRPSLMEGHKPYYEITTGPHGIGAPITLAIGYREIDDDFTVSYAIRDGYSNGGRQSWTFIPGGGDSLTSWDDLSSAIHQYDQRLSDAMASAPDHLP